MPHINLKTKSRNRLNDHKGPENTNYTRGIVNDVITKYFSLTVPLYTCVMSYDGGGGGGRGGGAGCV